MFSLAFPSFNFSYFPSDSVLSDLNFQVYLCYLFSSFKFIQFPANYILLFFSSFSFIWPDAKDIRSSVFHFQVLSLLGSTSRFISLLSHYVLSFFSAFVFTYFLSKISCSFSCHTATYSLTMCYYLD